MRLFGGERVQALMETLKIDETEPIQMKMLTNSIESAQKKVEGRNFGIRRNVLQLRRRHEQTARDHLRSALPRS